MPKPMVLQIVGYKKSGKTTLICELIRRFASLGLRVGTIKRDAHEFNMDHEGTDTSMHRQAGAQVSAITSPSQTAMMSSRSTSLEQLIEQFNSSDFSLDIIIVEGFKTESYPKLVLLRNDADLALLDQVTEIAAVRLGEHSECKAVKLSCPIFRSEQLEELWNWVYESYTYHKGMNP
jgi:molybdopterin-guanine dinucleotide biosynthesis adapter protein